MQLCAQAAETLSYLVSEFDLDLVRVDPAPDASRLLVTVRSTFPKADPEKILETLSRESLRLREEVAASITRKRAPSLSFQVLTIEADPRFETR